MGHHDEVVGQGMRDEVIISPLQEDTDSCRFVSRVAYPFADSSEGLDDALIRAQEKCIPTRPSPGRQSVVTGLQFVAHLFDTVHLPLCIGLNQPIPKPRANVEAVVYKFLAWMNTFASNRYGIRPPPGFDTAFEIPPGYGSQAADTHLGKAYAPPGC